MLRNILFLLLGFISSIVAEAQYIFTEHNLPVTQSILSYSSIADAENRNLSITEVKNGTANLKFSHLKGNFGNLGFTSHNFWLKFDLKNNLNTDVFYYLKTAEPITDHVNLYTFNKQGKVNVQKSGDNINFIDRSVANGKTIFKIELKPGELIHAFLEVKNDGEKNSLPLTLISQQKLLETTYQEQLIMGVFYGILFVIAITYFFFYFALKEKSFLYYSLYVTFVGLCQFALDGFFHQYIDRSSSWINLHAVIISAIFGAYFFGKYSEIILGIKQRYTKLQYSFNLLYLLLAIVLAGVLLFPNFLKYSYPLVNLLTLFGMVLIFVSIAVLIKDKQQIDIYFAGGIFILFICILIAVLFNFGAFPDDISTDNITKPGIGLEIIALSLSMANRIRLLKTKQEEMQALALLKSEEMNDVKSYFLSNMSHELRTPLNAILGLASLMENESGDEKIKENCEMIRYASHGLISSVNDILDFSKIEKGELKLEATNFKVYEVLEKIKTGIQNQAEDKGLIFEFDSNIVPEITTIGDPVRLEQIIHNLLSNALKFTLNGTITLQAFSKIENDKMYLDLSIKDTGIGIAKEKLSSVFGLFSQTELNNKRKYGGFGIGLSIVKVLVDLHHGKIDLESKLDHGTSFLISLTYPIIASPEKNRNNFPTDYNDFLGKHILVVEDNPMNQMVIKMILKRWENTVVTMANDGAESLKLLKENKIDIVLMDLQMPIMDGYEAIAAIRNGDAGAHYINLPIIALTADVNAASKERVFLLGANDYMTKPVDQKLLYQKVTELCSY
ncbi:MAG: response regulator [Pedobacter sp.]|nr:response regulator [Pedobacter sp.]